jgi:hypothetical protein
MKCQYEPANLQARDLPVGCWLRVQDEIERPLLQFRHVTQS